jgi:hypothetical protein
MGLAKFRQKKNPEYPRYAVNGAVYIVQSNPYGSTLPPQAQYWRGFQRFALCNFIRESGSIWLKSATTYPFILPIVGVAIALLPAQQAVVSVLIWVSAIQCVASMHHSTNHF